MNAFVQVVLMACMWQEGYYGAFQSTGTQFQMDVYVKKAKTLTSAMFSSGKWMKQDYQMPWTEVPYYLWWDTCGAELCLWTNDFKKEKGLTVGYRYLEAPCEWFYAHVVLPSMSKWQMQMSLLECGHKFSDYVLSAWSFTDMGASAMPYFYKPRTATDNEVLQWAIDHAQSNGYESLVPFIRKLLRYYAKHRW